MPKVLAMEMLSNAEVLNFIRDKRKEYKIQPTTNTGKASSNTKSGRPPNLLRALDQHQAHLESDHYPYVKNPSVYDDARLIRVTTGPQDQDDSLPTSDVAAERRFNSVFAERIILPAVKRRLLRDKERLGRALTSEEKDRVIAQVDAERALSDAERLMVLNHAPTCVEMLQPMIENVEARYSDDEQAIIVEAILMAFRVDESAASALKGAEDGEMEVDA